MALNSQFFVLSLFLYPMHVRAQSSEKELAAIAAMEQWLLLVDSSHYGKSWQQAAGNFRAAVSKANWRVSRWYICGDSV